MGNILRAVAPTGHSENQDESNSGLNKRDRGGKDETTTATEKEAVLQACVGLTGGTTAVADASGRVVVADTTVSQTGVPGAAAKTARQKGASMMGAAPKSTLGVPKPTMPVFANQSGLEDNKDQLTPWEGPQRIRESGLTPEERAKFEGHLKQIFSKECLLGERIVYDQEDVAEVMRKVIPYLKSEPMLIEDVPFDISIVGDIHGQLHDLHRVFKHDEKDGKPGWECQKYIFLGNYVDRGRQGLEVIMALFCIKMLHPDRIFLLRGNHEFININLKHGFMEELNDRYVEPAKNLFFNINEAFLWLSVAAIIGNDYLCVHAGISPSMFTRRSMKGIYKPFYYSGDDILVHDIVWSDPAEGLRGTAFNAERGTSIYFGFEPLAFAMYSMEVKAVFRGHSFLSSGYEAKWHCLQSIFTATDHQDGGNDGAVAVIDAKGKLKVRILPMDPRRRRWEQQLRVLDGGPAHIEAAPKTKYGGTGKLTSFMEKIQ